MIKQRKLHLTGELTAIHETHCSVFLSGTDVTFWFHPRVTATLNGQPCKISDLAIGDTVTVIGDPVKTIIAVRP